jgi:beta-phosphoglucomutase
MPKIKACLFDLDGVICDTARYHYLGWKKLANELGFDITHEQNEALKGVNRMDSLERILDWGYIRVPENEKEALAAKKNEWYLEYVRQMTPDDVLPGVVALFNTLKSRDIKIVLGSASKNARLILDLLQLNHYFDDIIDGAMVENGKPDPEVFLKGAAAAGCLPKECIVFEDALEGVKAGQAAGCYTVGIGDMKSLKRANLVISSFEDISFDEMLSCLY